MRQKLVAGNWKMNGRIQSVDALISSLLEKMNPSDVLTVVLPPYVFLPRVKELLEGSAICWGAQNLYPLDSGAVTGEISTPMLREFGCRYALVGHSERRQIFKENENFVSEKFHHAKLHGIIPILCVGETLEEREKGLTEQVINQQLRAIVKPNQKVFNQCVIAYEPVWAIGTGRTATPEQAQAVHGFIRQFVAGYDEVDAENLSILYGGSVNEKNAKALFSMPDIDGGLVGGASLNAEQFLEIVECIN